HAPQHVEVVDQLAIAHAERGRRLAQPHHLAADHVRHQSQQPLQLVGAGAHPGGRGCWLPGHARALFSRLITAWRGSAASLPATSAPNEARCSANQDRSEKGTSTRSHPSLPARSRVAQRRSPNPVPARIFSAAVCRSAGWVSHSATSSRTSVPSGTLTEPRGPLKSTRPSIRLSRNTLTASRTWSWPATYQRPCRFT